MIDHPSLTCFLRDSLNKILLSETASNVRYRTYRTTSLLIASHHQKRKELQYYLVTRVQYFRTSEFHSIENIASFIILRRILSCVTLSSSSFRTQGLVSHRNRDKCLISTIIRFYISLALSVFEELRCTVIHSSPLVNIKVVQCFHTLMQ